MNLTKHYLLTVLALLFWGVLIARPSATFLPKENRECEDFRTRVDCEKEGKLYKRNNGAIYYEYE